MRCLVVVAHPDDETIWMGGTILRYCRWEWHLLSLCRQDDPDRAPRFRDAARALGARAYMSDLDDSPTLAALSADQREIKQRIAGAVPRDWGTIFTHGPRGEYTRHERHEQVHRAVREMVDAGDLRGNPVYFSYEDGGGHCTPRPSANAGHTLELAPSELDEKRHIVRNIYGFQEDSFEYASAGRLEAFSCVFPSLLSDSRTLPIGGFKP